FATRISSPPIACSAAGTKASTSALTERLQGNTWTRSASLAASASSASRLVPEMATAAPRACSACATAPPMPPVAPVTSAVLPIKSNIDVSSMQGGHRFLGGSNLIGAADGNADRTFGNALDQSAQNLAGADFEKPGHPAACHISDRLTPAHRTSHLLDQ